MKSNNMKKYLAVTALVAVFSAASTSRAAIIAAWTMESPTTPADLNDSASGPTVAASTGTGSLQGVHASAASDWSTPAGNGSAESYSVNTWAVGDYFQFSTSTLGSSDIAISWDQTSSGTGPRDFKVQYSTDGSTFTDAGYSYAVLANASPNPTWNSSTSSPIYTSLLPPELDHGPQQPSHRLFSIGGYVHSLGERRDGCDRWDEPN